MNNNVTVIAHRGNFLPEGPIPEVQDQYKIPENTLEAFKRAFKNGWGIETDIRITGDGNFICLHDENTVSSSEFKIPTLDELCELAQKKMANKLPTFVAFQIKRGADPNSGMMVGRVVANKIRQCKLKNNILFDATLEEAQVLHQEFPWLNLSVSVGEANYSPTIYTPDQALSTEFTNVFSSVWADEWKIQGSIYNEEMFKKFRAAYPGRIDVISPELHYNENHPLSKDLSGLKKLWVKIINWRMVNGICTDHPTLLHSLQ